jgi:prolipoprotein diacylglyceryltransferase
MSIWKIINIVILSLFAAVVVWSTTEGRITFGNGLGDLYWYGLMYIIIIGHASLTFISRKRSPDYFVKLAVAVFFVIFWLCLEATVWRNSEYPWNGNIFYKGK